MAFMKSLSCPVKTFTMIFSMRPGNLDLPSTRYTYFLLLECEKFIDREIPRWSFKIKRFHRIDVFDATFRDSMPGHNVNNFIGSYRSM